MPSSKLLSSSRKAPTSKTITPLIQGPMLPQVLQSSNEPPRLCASSMSTHLYLQSLDLNVLKSSTTLHAKGSMSSFGMLSASPQSQSVLSSKWSISVCILKQVTKLSQGLQRSKKESHTCIHMRSSNMNKPSPHVHVDHGTTKD